MIAQRRPPVRFYAIQVIWTRAAHLNPSWAITMARNGMEAKIELKWAILLVVLTIALSAMWLTM